MSHTIADDPLNETEAKAMTNKQLGMAANRAKSAREEIRADHGADEMDVELAPVEKRLGTLTGEIERRRGIGLWG
jgi:hypothetical protein